MAAPFNKAEAFYIESHFGKKSAEEIAKDLGKTVKKVQAYLDKLAEAGVEPAKPATADPVQQAGFAVHQGDSSNVKTVSMTPQTSQLGDEIRGVTADGTVKKKPRNDKFFGTRVPKNIHIIRPGEPVL
jgi:hypothetical protein